ncbi:MAG: hypothetical protein HC837_12810 [Chloroflexaceae bacterium]|nr:hypothetical protein [Chloroflexaceae bacterium]
MKFHQAIVRAGYLFIIGLLLLSLTATSLYTPVEAAKGSSVIATPVLQQAAKNTTALPAFTEIEPNDFTPPDRTVNAIDPDKATVSWQRTITGHIALPGDYDWFSFRIENPASIVQLTLDNLPRDYDLVLIRGADTSIGPNGIINNDEGLSRIIDLGRGGKSTGRGGKSTGRGGKSTGRGGKSTGGHIISIGRGGKSTGGDITAVSNQPFTNTEYIETIAWLPGTYYAVVAAENGAYSPDETYTLDVQVDGNNLDAPPEQEVIGIDIPPEPAVQTLFVLSGSRMRKLYGDASASTIDNIILDINLLAQRPEVAGAVLNLDNLILSQDDTGNTRTITNAYNLWDADPTNPLYANYIAQVIDNFITAATFRNFDPAELALGNKVAIDPPFPNIAYIVLVGGDDIIPFYRVPDLVTLANQEEYPAYLETVESNGIIDPGSPIAASLFYRTVLTDNIYGTDDYYNAPDHPLMIPTRAVGRLVETPDEIWNYLHEYAQGDTPLVIDASGPDRKAVVTGYDFLSDQASIVADTLETIGFSTTETLTILNSPLLWDAADLGNAWFDGRLDLFTSDYTDSSSIPLQSINAHFDFWQAIPAAADANQTDDTFLAERILNPDPAPGASRYFENRLCYSVGCHSGLTIGNDWILEDTPNIGRYHADFPQAFMRQGGTFIGNTTYGYGDVDLVGYSERFSLIFTQELGRIDRVGGVYGNYEGQPIGRAMVRARQRYIRNATYLDVFDLKALTAVTLYGLPFLGVRVRNPTDFPDDELPPDNTPDTVPPVDAPLGKYERLITFTVSYTERVPFERNSDVVYSVIDTITARDSFAEGGSFTVDEPRIIDAVQEGYPMFPQFAYDLSARNVDDTQEMVVKDISFVGGEYITSDNYRPNISQVITQSFRWLDLAEDFVPDFETGSGVWYPDNFYDYTETAYTVDSSSTANRYQLLVTPSQFQVGKDNQIGDMRLYETMVFQVTYIDPQAPDDSALQDTESPIIEWVRVITNDDDSTEIIAVVTDDPDGDDPLATGIEAVDLRYVVDGDEWITAPMQYDGKLDRWFFQLPDTNDIVDLQFRIDAFDRAGNIARYTGKGTFETQESPVLRQVAVVGPTKATLNMSVTFTAAVTPAVKLAQTTDADESDPTLYEWSPGPDTGQGTATATYVITNTGSISLEVRAENLVSSVGSNLFTLEVEDDIDPPDPTPLKNYLPLVRR